MKQSKDYPILIFYSVSPVHMRNLNILSKRLEGWKFRVIYNAELKWFSPDKIEQYPYDCIPCVDAQIPDALWKGDVRAVIMSTAQVLKLPFNLVKSALIHGVPVIAIEEVHQLALHGKRINNYMLPVDELLVASEIEREEFINLGYPADHVHSTGWPFYSGLISNKGCNTNDELRNRLGLKEGQPIATLTLLMSSRHECISVENDYTRRQLLSIVSKGLPSNYQLLVKGHPAEDPKGIKKFVKKYAPRAKLVERYVDIQDVLSITDVLFNQGHSQVVMEALLRGLPVIIVPVGVNTIFDGILKDLIIRKPDDITRALSILDDDYMKAYASFFQTHLSIPPQKALEFTVQRITEFARSGKVREPVEKLRELVLWEACLIGRDKIDDTLELIKERIGESSFEYRLERLVRGNADHQDIVDLLNWAEPGLRRYAIQSLWINTMVKRGLKPGEADLALVKDFPPQMMGALFMKVVFRWGNYLYKCGYKQAAEILTCRLDNEFGYMNSVRNYVAKFPHRLGQFTLTAYKLTPQAILFLADKLWHYTKQKAIRRIYRS